MRRVSGDGKHPDSCKHVLLRGRARERGLGWLRKSARSLQPRATPGVGDHGVLEQLRRRGTSSHLVMRRSHARRGEVLRSRRLGPRSLQSSYTPSSAQPEVGSRRRPQAAVRSAVTFGVPTFRRACSAGRRTLSRLTWLAVRPSRKGRAVACRASSKGEAREAGTERGGRAAPKGPNVQGGRGSDARKGCARAL